MEAPLRVPVLLPRLDDVGVDDETARLERLRPIVTGILLAAVIIGLAAMLATVMQ